MFRLIRNLKRKDFALLLCCVTLIFAMVWLELKMPEYMANITRLVQTEGSEMHEIYLNGGMMLGCAGLSLLFSIGVSFVISTIAARFSLIIRKMLFDKRKMDEHIRRAARKQQSRKKPQTTRFILCHPIFQEIMAAAIGHILG